MNMRRIAGALGLVLAMLSVAPSTTLAYTKIPAKTVHSCNNTGQCKDTYYPEFPNAGACTRFFRQWRNGYDNDNAIEACTDFMGMNKYCADHDSYVAVGFVPQTDFRTLHCSPRYHSDSIGDQIIHIWTGIGEGLLTAAPFVAEGVLGVTCVYGQIYACAVLALEVSDQAGLKIPTEVGDAIYIANKAPQCIDGDVVACAYLGVRGAKAAGLEIPGVPAIKVFEDSQKCNAGEFAACVRLGKEAADAGGIETGSLTGDLIDGQACLDGNKDTCVKLAKEAIQDHVPINDIAGAADNAAACDKGDSNACAQLGRRLASVASGLPVAKPAPNDFNGDNLPDIVWYNEQTGETQIWFMNVSSRIGRATVVDEGGKAILIGLPWRIVGSRDFNRDSNTDLLWYNDATGAIQIWFMAGSKIASRATVLGEDGSGVAIGPPWGIVGTDDMNGDGNGDIIWHNSATGETQLWLMNGYRVAGRATVLGEDGAPAFVGLPWSIVGSDDMNRDGKSDLLWHNAASGETQIWYMNVHKVTGRATVLSESSGDASVGLPWQITGSNDFDQDGTSDILWHNESTGETQIWFMNGRTVKRRATVDATRDGGGAMVGVPWRIVPH